jgi:putative transposase
MVRDLMIVCVERIGSGPARRHMFVEWLSDNGSAYIAKDMLDTATDLGLRLDPLITSFLVTLGDFVRS